MEPIVHRRTHLSASLLTSSGDMLSGILSSGEPMNSYRNISMSERERKESRDGLLPKNDSNAVRHSSSCTSSCDSRHSIKT